MFSFLAHLSCTKCGKQFERDSRRDLCAACGGPLFARYHPRPLDRSSGAARARTIWRWHEMMPVEDPENVVSLGEGGTPLLRAERLGSPRGLRRPLDQGRGRKPDGLLQGARPLGGRLPREGARPREDRASDGRKRGRRGGGLRGEGRHGMPRLHAAGHAAPLPPRMRALRREGDAGGRPDRRVRAARGRARAAKEGWHDVSTLKEPYRVEGKKTMGYELAEDLGWELPDAIVYPTGGGTGLIGMWKAFEEMEELGWIGSKRPRMISVQAAGCAPIPKALAEGSDVSEKWENASTYASGLRVPEGLRRLSDPARHPGLSRRRCRRDRRGDAPGGKGDRLGDGALRRPGGSGGLGGSPEARP